MKRVPAKFSALLSFMVIIWLPPVGNAQYLVDNSNISAGVFDFLYATKTNTADSGGDVVVGAPWLSNSGWTHDPNRSVNVGDGGFVELYHFVAPSPVGCPNSSLGPVTGGALLDITGLLSEDWLNAPDLLELRFSHSSPGSPYSVAENTQVFRQDAFHEYAGVRYGFRLRVELVADSDGDGDGVPDGSDNCPDDTNPGQEDNDGDGDGDGDVCDGDDDNDGIADFDDNCPIDSNVLQEDFDLDGLGNACDGNFSGNEIIAEIEALVLDPPGGNGMLAKLTGKGGVLAKAGNAITAFDLGLIDTNTYLGELDGALGMLAAFDNQLDAKVANDQILAFDGSELTALSAGINIIIDALVIAVGG
jgi:hypothetical protein